MTPVTLRLPASILRRFRTLASEMLTLPVDVPDGQTGPTSAARTLHFHEALVHAVAEAMLEHPLGVLKGPPATLQPLVVVSSAVPDAAAEFMAQLAMRSELTLEDAWHRVVLEFCERECAPGLDPAHARAA